MWKIIDNKQQVMNWATDGTNIHPRDRFIGDFIWNISGRKRFQQVIFVIRRIVGSDINSTFLSGCCWLLFFCSTNFNLTFHLFHHSHKNWQPCPLFTNVGVILWWSGSYEILMSFGNEVGARFSWALVLSIFYFEFDFVEMRWEGDFLQVSQEWEEWWKAWKHVKAWAPPCVNEEDFLQTLHMIWW